ncbi:MAG: acyl carrier protein [Ruminococcaceae bacterium]|nr:acyl carrier protein [Oscillospiraceae bacterium]
MFEKLKSILEEELQLDVSGITLESNLSNDLGINSIELADLVMVCEEKFDIEFKDEDIYKFATVGDVVKFLEENA